MDGDLPVALDVGHLIVVVFGVTWWGMCGLNGQPEPSNDGSKGRVGIRAEVTLTILAGLTATGGNCTAEALRHAAPGAAIPERLTN
jgi:hypothetical protein